MICLVTDRRRLGTALGLGSADWVEALQEQVSAAVRAGIDLVQVREPDLEADELTSLVRSLVRSAHGQATRILVNDRLDVAIAAGASGVHLKEQSFPPHVVRRMVPHGFVIGASVHSTAGVVARNGSDFLIAGTVLPTASKPAVEHLNVNGLREIVRAAAGQPVLGIGGLDIRSIPLLASACAAGLAAVGAFIPEDRAGLSDFVQKRVTELRLTLESPSPRS